MAPNQIGRILHIALVFSIIVILFSSSFDFINAQISSEKPSRLALVEWTHNWFAYIAEEKGYFEKNKVAVNLTLIQNYCAALALVVYVVMIRHSNVFSSICLTDCGYHDSTNSQFLIEGKIGWC